MDLELEFDNWSSSQPAGSSTVTPIFPPTSVPIDTNVIPPQTSPSDSLSTPSPPISVSSPPVPSPSLSNAQSLTNSYTTFTTSYPIVISQSSTTFTSYVTSIVTTSTAITMSQTATPQSNLGVNSVCIGHGIDSVSIGLLAVAIFSAFLGFIVWVRTARDPKYVHLSRVWLTSEL